MTKKTAPTALETIDRYAELKDAIGSLYAACCAPPLTAPKNALPWLSGHVLELAEALGPDLEALLQPPKR